MKTQTKAYAQTNEKVMNLQKLIWSTSLLLMVVLAGCGVPETPESKQLEAQASYWQQLGGGAVVNSEDLFMTSFDGQSWAVKTRLNTAAFDTYAPSISIVNGTLNMAWMESGSMYVSRLCPGSTLVQQVRVPGACPY